MLTQSWGTLSPFLGASQSSNTPTYNKPILFSSKHNARKNLCKYGGGRGEVSGGWEETYVRLYGILKTIKNLKTENNICKRIAHFPLPISLNRG